MPPEYGPFEYDGKGHVRTIPRLVRGLGWIREIGEDGKPVVVRRRRKIPRRVLIVSQKRHEKEPHINLCFNGKRHRVKQKVFIDDYGSV